MDTNSPLTFGKFKNWTPAELAQAGTSGRQYLSWGANNLKSPQWQGAFRAALNAPCATDIDLAARALMKDDPFIDPDDAYNFVIEQEAQRIEEEVEVASWKAARLAVAEEWAPRTGKSAAEMQALARQVENQDWWDIPLSRFSSPAARETFMGFMEAYSKAK